jgi:hypothetical protein
MKKVYKMVAPAHVFAVRAVAHPQHAVPLKMSTNAVFQRRRHTS